MDGLVYMVASLFYISTVAKLYQVNGFVNGPHANRNFLRLNLRVRLHEKQEASTINFQFIPTV